MSSSTGEETTHIEAELVLTVILKLLGVYLLFRAASQSNLLLDEMIATANRSSLDVAQLGRVLSSSGSLAITAGLAILLIRHGDRAAHWLSVPSGINARFATPSARWYRGAIALIGVWLLVTHGLGAIYSVVLFAVSVFDTSRYGEIFGSPANGILALVDLISTLAIGLTLVFAAPRLGDKLNHITADAIAKPVNTTEQ